MLPKEEMFSQERIFFLRTICLLSKDFFCENFSFYSKQKQCDVLSGRKHIFFLYAKNAFLRKNFLLRKPFFLKETSISSRKMTCLESIFSQGKHFSLNKNCLRRKHFFVKEALLSQGRISCVVRIFSVGKKISGVRG